MRNIFLLTECQSSYRRVFVVVLLVSLILLGVILCTFRGIYSSSSDFTAGGVKHVQQTRGRNKNQDVRDEMTKQVFGQS